MDFRQMKNDAYGIGQRRGMGNAGGGGGLGDFSSNYGGGGGYNGGNYGGGGPGNQGGYGGNRNQSPDSGSYNRGGGSGNFDGGPRGNNNYSRSIDDRGFNANINSNQRFGNANDNFQDNFRGQSDIFGSLNRGGGGGGTGSLQSNLQRVLELEEMRGRNSGGNFNSEMSSNYRGQSSQGSGDRFYNDSPRNPGNFGGNSGSNYGPNDGPSFGGTNDNFRGQQQSQNFNDQQRSGYNDSYGRGGNFGGQNSGNYGGPDSGNFGGPDSGNFRGPDSGNFGGQNSGNFGGQNFTDNFNNRGPQRGGGNFSNSGSGGGFNSSSGSGFSNNISRSFNEANSRNWSNATNQSSSFQSSGYQSNNNSGGGGGGSGGGGPTLSGWEASQRAFNSKRNQLQKINMNNGGAVRKPGPQPAAKAVYNMRNNPNAAAAVTTAAGRNTQQSKPGNVRPGTAAGVQNKAPNQYKLVNAATKTNSAGVAQKKPPVAGQPIKAGPGAVKSGPQPVKKGPSGVGTGPPGAKTGAQGGVRAGPQGARAAPQGARSAPQGARAGPQGARAGPQGARAGPQGARSGPLQGVPRGPKPGNPAAGVNKPPNAPGMPPQAGQKRVAPAPPFETEAAPKSVKKWRRVARKRGFLMGGFKLPYLNDQPKKLPQPESESYALTFFEQTFNYSTNQEAVDEDFSEDAVLLNDLSDDESSEEVKVARKGGKKNRKRIRGEWAPLYESKKYKEWDNWWKDYKQYGEKIEKKLEEVGNYNLEHCFLPNLPMMSTEEVVFAIIKSAHFVLEKNADVPYDTMKTIFTLMNRTFLENLTELNILEVQDLIRNIPNDLWVYKLKSMIFLWSKYETIHSSKSTEEEKVKDQQSTTREWKSPVFHWLAKQAFDELVAISETEWKEHRTLFPAAE